MGENQWVSIREHLPPQPGLYFVLAESADPDKPLFCTAWYEGGWSLMIAAFIPAITHWMKPARPIAEPMAILPCPKSAEGLHDFRHEVCDCGASRDDTLIEPRKG